MSPTHVPRGPFAAHSNIILAVGLITILATLLIPLPTAFLDMLIASSISLSLAVLIVTLSSKEALELSTFPSLLLFVTLFRGNMESSFAIDAKKATMSVLCVYLGPVGYE